MWHRVKVCVSFKAEICFQHIVSDSQQWELQPEQKSKAQMK